MMGSALPERPHASEADDGIFEQVRDDPGQAMRNLDNAMRVLGLCADEALKTGGLTESSQDLLKTLPGDIHKRVLAFSEPSSGIIVVVVDPELRPPGTAENKIAEMLANEVQHIMRGKRSVL